MSEKEYRTDVDDYMVKRATKIKEQSETVLLMIDAYGGDNLPTKTARADAQTRLNCANYLLSLREKQR